MEVAKTAVCKLDTSPRMLGELDEVEKAYIAGFIDGEGYIGINRTKSLWLESQLSITNSNKYYNGLKISSVLNLQYIAYIKNRRNQDTK